MPHCTTPIKKSLAIMAWMVILTIPVHANPLGEAADLDLKGNSPLQDGINAWFYGLDTALGGNKYIADVLDQNSIFHNFTGQPLGLHDKEEESAENYENTHNHYQNLFVQTLNKLDNVNAVSIWGDSTSIVDGAKSWGGFFSARSACSIFAAGGPLQDYGDPELTSCRDHDNQLIGIEIDVLNGSKPGIHPNMSKTGLQIVGFGNPNSMAIEVRSEDTDRLQAGTIPGGAFESAFYVKNSLHPDYGRLVVADFTRAKTGIDLRKPLFSEGAMQFNSQGVGTGLIINEGQSGEIYGGDRWPGFADRHGWLTVRLGDGGVRVVSNDNTRELLAIDNFGGIYLDGDLYLNGKRWKPETPRQDWYYLGFVLAFTFINLFLTGLAFWRTRR